MDSLSAKPICRPRLPPTPPTALPLTPNAWWEAETESVAPGLDPRTEDIHVPKSDALCRPVTFDDVADDLDDLDVFEDGLSPNVAKDDTCTGAPGAPGACTSGACSLSAD